jgi:hypothetical protein
MWTRRDDWRRGLQRRLVRPTTDERDWLIELQVQIGIQDMASSAARIAHEERAAAER